MTCREAAIPGQYSGLHYARGNKDLSELNGFSVAASYRDSSTTACSIHNSHVSFQSPYSSAGGVSGTVQDANQEDCALFYLVPVIC